MKLPVKLELRNYQIDGVRRGYGKEGFGYLMEQGLGKTAAIIAEAGALFLAGDLDLLVVVAPNGVHLNWCDELRKTALFPYKVAVWRSDLSASVKQELTDLYNYDGDALRVLLVNVEAFSWKKASPVVTKFLKRYRSMIVVDESSRIKNHTAERTKALTDVGAYAMCRRIATGTPMTRNPLDFYAQFNFADKNILQCPNYYVFRARYAVVKEIRLPPVKGRSSGRERRFKKVVGFKNLDKLIELVAPYCHVVRKKDSGLDLPEKIYQKRYVEMGKQQAKLYAELARELCAVMLVDDLPVAVQVNNVMTKIMRLQQIAGGFFPLEDGSCAPIPDATGVDDLINLTEELDGGVIVWARFTAEREAIYERLCKVYGKDAVVRYYGGVSDDERKRAKHRFQDGSARFFVGNPQVAGIGLTLTAGRTSIYYSNDQNLENRLQSEDRTHRLGTVDPPVYIDYIRNGTVDESIVASNQNKAEFADTVMNALQSGSMNELLTGGKPDDRY